MQKLYFSFLAVFAFVSMQAQTITFADPDFLAALVATPSCARDMNLNPVAVDINNSGTIEVSEAEQIDVIFLDPDDDVTDLGGIEHFAHLKVLNIDYCVFTELDVSQLTELISLSCRMNQLTALDVSHSPNLKSLDCAYNMIASLNVSGLVFSYFTCEANLLTTLTVAFEADMNPIPMVTFNCGLNLLTSLNLTGNFREIVCNINQLESLDLSRCYFSYVDMNNNEPLTWVSVKNGFIDFPELIFSPNDFSTLPNLTYFCVDDAELADFEFIVPNFSDAEINTYCSFAPGGHFNTIAGSTTFDHDGNGCDASDLDMPHLRYNVDYGSAIGQITADSNGNFMLPVQDGTYTITPVFENANYFNVSPLSATISFPANADPFAQNFCITANGAHNDLSIVLLPLTQAVPGFDVTYKIIYRNSGTTTQSGSVNFTFDNGILDFVSSVPNPLATGGNLIVWDFDELAPFEQGEIILMLNLNSPVEIPAVNNGDVLGYNAAIVVATDETPDNNTVSLNQTVVNSLDPNDKTCLEGNTVSPAMAGEYVHYQIRFENSGTTNAVNVVVKDVIDVEKYDATTLVPLDGSHNYYTRVNGNNVEFIFENINLPFDDANNDGYVVFKIKTLPTLEVGDTFSNSASIYFDFNHPIVTEPAVTAIDVLKNQDFEFGNSFPVYPNPVDNVLNIEMPAGIEVQSIAVYNALGQLVLVADATKSIDVSGLTSGSYFLKVHSQHGIANIRFLKN